jgi:hypothetical protein
MQLESGAKLIHLAPRFIMGLSDEEAVLNYDNSMTGINRSHALWAEA